MANIWQDAVITNKGIALLTKLIEGTNLNITRAAIGTGTVAVASLMQQTEVSGSMMELSFLLFTYPEQGKVKLPVSLTNDNVDTGFVGKQIGLFASDPDEGEILFLIAQANQFTEVTGVSIPSKTEQPGFSAQWDFVFEYGQTDGITVVVDPAAALTRDIADTLYVSSSTLAEALQGKADLGDDGKIPESQLPGMDYIPTSEKGTANGVAELDSVGKVPESQLPEMDYDAKGSANAALIDAKAYTDTSAAQMLTAAKEYADSLTPTFIYECTGTADSTAIAKIINDFFNNGTAMNMKLIISGTMGVAFTRTYYAIYIDALNTRGARVFLDFSDCYIPEIITENRDFLNLNSEVNLDIFGLVVATMRCGVLCARALSVTFTNCSIKGGTQGIRVNGNFRGVITVSDNCKLIGGSYGLISETANTAAVIKLADCQIKGGKQDVFQTSADNTMHWLIKGCSFSKANIYVNSATISVSSTVANAYLAIQAYHNLFSQTIS